MNYLSVIRNASIDANEDFSIEKFCVGVDTEVCVPVQMINEFLNAVPCAIFSRRLSAWKVPEGADEKLAKFQWFASE